MPSTTPFTDYIMKQSSLGSDFDDGRREDDDEVVDPIIEDPQDPLRDDILFYKENAVRLLDSYTWKYLVISWKRVVKTFATHDEARLFWDEYIWLHKYIIRHNDGIDDTHIEQTEETMGLISAIRAVTQNVVDIGGSVSYGWIQWRNIWDSITI